MAAARAPVVGTSQHHAAAPPLATRRRFRRAAPRCPTAAGHVCKKRSPWSRDLNRSLCKLRTMVERTRPGGGAEGVRAGCSASVSPTAEGGDSQLRRGPLQRLADRICIICARQDLAASESQARSWAWLSRVLSVLTELSRILKRKKLLDFAAGPATATEVCFLIFKNAFVYTAYGIKSPTIYVSSMPTERRSCSWGLMT